MFVDITDNRASIGKTLGGKTDITLDRLAGSDVEHFVLFYNDHDQSQLKITFRYSGENWFIQLLRAKRIYKGCWIEISLENDKLIKYDTKTGGFKYNEYWSVLFIITYEDMLNLTECYVKEIKVVDVERDKVQSYFWGDNFNGQYNTSYEGAELLRLACRCLMTEFEKVKEIREVSLPINPINTRDSYHGPILNHQYNLNTKYGQRMAAKQARYNYEHGSPEYKKEIDKISAGVWTVILVICFIIFLLIWAVSGPTAAVRWLR